MNIWIKDRNLNDKIIAEIPIKLQGHNYIPSANQYFEAAWLIALDAGLVKSENKKQYIFEFSDRVIAQ